YSVAVAAVLYRFGSRLYDKRAGLLAAALFVIFSTTYTTGHFQGLNTDFLMLLPYTLGAYWLLRSRASARGAKLALAGGVMVGFSFQTNPKAIFDFLLILIPVSFFRNETPFDEDFFTAEAQSTQRQSGEEKQLAAVSKEAISPKSLPA